MSPSPVTFASPDQPASYTWEATDEEVAARYSLAVDSIVRFDLNTSPTPPGLASRLLAAGQFESPLSEYPPSDYRRLVAAAASTYGVAADELLVGAGADEILDLAGKAFLPAGGTAVIPVPSYAMYRVITEQRAARVLAVARRPAAGGWAMDVDAVREAARTADLVWLCSPNNPTGLPEPPGAIEELLTAIATDADSAARLPAMVVLDEAYAEFLGETLLPLRLQHPNLVIVRTASKAYALAGLRVGFAIAQPATIARIAPYRPPGSVSTISVTVVTEALKDPHGMVANVARVDAERLYLADGLRDAGWSVGPTVTNFLLVDLGSPDRAAATATGMLRRGLVPRTFGSGHPLAQCLRLTIRDRAGNDRLIAAAREIEAERADRANRAPEVGDAR